jgi:GNAT superfamily N-acetyltransferase
MTTLHDAITSRSFFIEPFAERDRHEVFTVFDSNVPHAFAATERHRFEAFLNNPPGPAWVARMVDGNVVGFGALSFSDATTAWLRWSMVRSDIHRQGVGRALLEVRLDWIRTQTSCTAVRVATTEPVAGFFTRVGFVLERVTPDGIEPGIDRYDLLSRAR